MTTILDWDDRLAVWRERAEIMQARGFALGEIMALNEERLAATMRLARGDTSARKTLRLLAKIERQLRRDIDHYDFALRVFAVRMEPTPVQRRAAG